MSSRELCKLDGQSPTHIDAGQKPTGPRDRVDMLPDLSVPRNLHSGHSTPDDVILDLRRAHGLGVLTEQRMLDAFVRNLGGQRVDLTLTPPDRDLLSQADPALCLRYQCLPWRQTHGTLWIATSAPEHVDRFVAASGQLCPPDVMIRPVYAPRAALQAAIASAHRPALTGRMTERTALNLSARRWSPLVGIAIICGFVLALGTLLLAPGLAVLPAMLTVAILSVAISSTLKLSAAITHLIRPDPPVPTDTIPDDALPLISILVPLYKETRIASALLRRLSRLDYPPHRLEVILVLEETDTLTRAAIDSAPLPPWFHIVTVPDGTPRTKPRAMNYALDFANGDIIGVYDAEDAPDPDQLRKVAHVFAAAPENVACLQGALDYYNRRQNWITRCFTIEYNTWFRLLMPGMAKLGFAVPLGGTTIFFRRGALEKVGAWDAHNVTEDADLGMRLARFGYRTRVIPTTTGEEASARPVQWVRQRSRWLKGYLMTYAVHMRHPLRLWRDLGTWQYIGFQAHFLTAILQFTLAPMLWLFWLVAFGFDLPNTQVDSSPRFHLLILALLGFECLNIILGAIATNRDGYRHLWPWLPTLHLYWPMGCFAMWKALYELAARPFYWDKTPHGLSTAPVATAPAPVTEASPPRPANPRPAAQPTGPISPESSFSRATKALDM